MKISSHQEQELVRLEQFITKRLTAQQSRVLQLFATQGAPYKEVAIVINRDIKTVEKIVNIITHRYQEFFGSSEQNASFRRIQNRAACYYFFKDLLEESQELIKRQ